MIPTVMFVAVVFSMIVVPSSIVAIPIVVLPLAVSAPVVVGEVSGLCFIASSAVVAASALAIEAMAAPAMTISPACPRPHAQEDAVVKIAGSIVSIGCARVGGYFVIPILAGWLNIDANGYLRRGSGG